MIKKIFKKIFILFILIIICAFPKTYATDEILESQMEALNLSSFVQEGKQYTKEVFPEVDLQKFFYSSLSGSIDNSGIFSGVLNSFTNEIKSTIKTLALVLIIIIIHSILKAISENVSNEGVSEIAYYIQYILIVTVVMSNFAQIIYVVRESITNLILFINTLIPLLIALITVSRKCCNKLNARTNNYSNDCIYWKCNY